MPVQLRFACEDTGEESVSRKGWQQATLNGCPRHPQGGCRFARHGTDARVSPPGTLITRYYCADGHRTFSLLPDCYAARLSGQLSEVEAVVRAVEQAPSQAAACGGLRLDIELPGVQRFVTRRVQAAHEALRLLCGRLPDIVGRCAPRLLAFALVLGVTEVLVTLRGIAEPWLQQLPTPLGFSPRRQPGGGRDRARQHRAGAAPPGLVAEGHGRRQSACVTRNRRR
jgi:hypothetical protein